ncbi:MAG: UDP-N-acetylmuramoyl-L-alanine--D-glutamate ligase [Clostridia bacterium]|nr:UDP-N-acetylmuramoyl-L-alanine--D-glutamate ligase [Clostridia bacterium]MDD4387301.1 UDP-N-acetylmuramoyl-L-alanine--D-glutamate ligase [Clostridia bacterium]
MNNLKLEKFKQEIYGKKVAVIGIGVSNIPAIEYLNSLGAVITACDKKIKLGDECSKLFDLNLSFNLGENYLSDLTSYDYILRSPGIKPFTKELEEAKDKGVQIISEIELLVSLCPCKIIGITGSDGKTTTTTLVSKFLKEAGFNVYLGGNIGIPLFSKLDKINKNDIVVVELSSFQLMSMKESPTISCITNISPNHLDYHRSFEEYVLSKANIFLHQKNGIIVLNADNNFTTQYLNLIKLNNINSSVRKFSVIDKVKEGVYLDKGYIVSNINGKYEEIAKISDVKLVGIHNLANICAAASCVIDITGTDAITSVITTFRGVEHRMELFRTINGVNWYNDSIGTSPARTIAGLLSFDDKIILIAGGYDKNIPYDEIGKYIIDNVKILILIGKTAPKIEKAVLDEKLKQGIDNICEIVNFSTLEECVTYANNISKSGDNVVLSPASASFDMYKNFEERGDYFKMLVNNI